MFTTYEDPYFDESDFGQPINESPFFTKRGLITAIVSTTVVVLVFLSIELIGIFYAFDVLNVYTPDNGSFEGKIVIQNIMNHLQNLEDIAKQHSNSRAMNLGYNASIDYVESQLLKYPDYFTTPVRQVFPVVQVVDLVEPQFAQVLPNAKTYKYGVDFQSISYSGTGDLSDLVISVGSGCTEADYTSANFVAGKIAIAQNTPDCRTSVRAQVAETMAVGGLLIYNDEAGFFASSAKTPFGFPIFALSDATGLEIAQTLAIGTPVTVSMKTSTEEQTSYTTNLLVDTPSSGDGSKIIITGSHLDSVPEGPGINDNGSGSSANLEMALLFASTNTIPVNRVRFAWWAAEELGLKGSRYYVSNLKETNPDELNKIALNVNYDMLGSPNFFRGIYNGTQGSDGIRKQSEKIMNLYIEFFNRFGLPWGLTDFDGRSDYGPFLEENIPAGGLFTGAEVIKTAEQKLMYGGIANMSYDTCYHLACDTLDNINREILEEMAQAAAYAVHTLAMEPHLDTFLTSP